MQIRFMLTQKKKLYPKIRDIALGQLKGDDCKTLMLEVIVEDTAAENHLAYVQEVLVKTAELWRRYSRPEHPIPGIL